jgi:hypothetical protein
VVVDVDPKGAGGDFLEALCAGAVAHCGVQNENDVEDLGRLRRLGDECGFLEEGKALRQPVFVPNLHVFAQLFKAKSHGERTTNGVAIGTKVAQDKKPLLVAKDRGNRGKGSVGIHESTADWSAVKTKGTPNSACQDPPTGAPPPVPKQVTRT